MPYSCIRLTFCVVFAENACKDKCGINTWCTGNWLEPDALSCSCFDGYTSPTNDGTACTSLLFTFLLTHLFSHHLVFCWCSGCPGNYHNHNHDYNCRASRLDSCCQGCFLLHCLCCSVICLPYRLTAGCQHQGRAQVCAYPGWPGLCRASSRHRELLLVSTHH